MQTLEGKEKATGKGINRCVLKKIPHQRFKDCIQSDHIIDQKQYFEANVIRSSKHHITTNQAPATAASSVVETATPHSQYVDINFLGASD